MPWSERMSGDTSRVEGLQMSTLPSQAAGGAAIPRSLPRRALIFRPAPAATGARPPKAWTEKYFFSSARTDGIQPALRAWLREQLDRILVAVFSVWIDSPRRKSMHLPATRTLWAAARLTRCIPTRCFSRYRRRGPEFGESKIAVELRGFIRSQQVQVERGGDAGGVVIGGVEDRGGLDEIDPDEQHRAAAEQRRRMPQKRMGLDRLEIADGRSREEADRASSRCSRAGRMAS